MISQQLESLISRKKPKERLRGQQQSVVRQPLQSMLLTLHNVQTMMDLLLMPW